MFPAPESHSDIATPRPSRNTASEGMVTASFTESVAAWQPTHRMLLAGNTMAEAPSRLPPK